MENVTNDHNLTRRNCRWKAALFFLGIALLGTIWVSTVVGKRVNGDVYAAYSASQLQNHARCLWLEILCNTQHVGKGVWPSNDYGTSTEYFRQLLKQGHLSEERITCIIKPPQPGLVHFLGKLLKGRTGKTAPSEMINRDSVEWAVVTGCDGQLFSETNKPADNLPFLITHNITGKQWIPAEGIKLANKGNKSQRHVVVITFGGQIAHFVVKKSTPCFQLDGLENITNNLMLAQP